MGKGLGEGGRGGKGRKKKKEDTWENRVTYFTFFLHNGTSMWILLLYNNIIVWLITSGAKTFVGRMESFAFIRP